MLSKTTSDRLKFFGLILFIVAIIVAIKAFGVANLLTPTMLREQVDSYGSFGPIVFIIMYAVATIAFIPGTPLTLASGVIFGKVLGTLYTVIGATIGATIAFLIARSLGESFVDKMLKGKHNKIYEYDQKLEKNGFPVVLFLRFVPIFPFNGLNFALGLTKVKFKDYFLGTMLGIIPGSFVLAYFGDSLAEMNIISTVIAAILFLAMIAVLPIYNRIKKRSERYKKKIEHLEQGMKEKKR